MIEQWGDELVSGWHEWIELPQRAGALLAEIVGAAPEEVVVTDSTTVNLYKLASAAIEARGLTGLVSDRGELPDRPLRARGDRRRARARAAAVRLRPARRARSPEDLAACGPGDLVVLSHVAYRSGALADMAALTAASPAAHA